MIIFIIILIPDSGYHWEQNNNKLKILTFFPSSTKLTHFILFVYVIINGTNTGFHDNLTNLFFSNHKFHVQFNLIYIHGHTFLCTIYVFTVYINYYMVSLT